MSGLRIKLSQKEVKSTRVHIQNKKKLIIILFTVTKHDTCKEIFKHKNLFNICSTVNKNKLFQWIAFLC